MVKANDVIKGLELNDRKLNWILIGVGLGYPTCCIKAFVDLEHMLDPEKRKLTGTGFIPCARCNSNKTTMDLVNEINHARDPKLPIFSHNPADHR